jgi:molecular chaperone GrpE
MTSDPDVDARVDEEVAAGAAEVAEGVSAAGAEPVAEEAAGAAEVAEGVVEGVAEGVAEAEAAIESDLLALQQERDDYLDALRRLQADFDNYRKRTVKQQTEHLERAAQTLVEKLLPVLDAADLAIAHGAGEAVVQVFGLLMDTLAKEGLEGVEPKPGDPFDPTVHEAVAHEPGDGGAQEIADVMRAGYRWKGALLRPAMVKVRG